MHASDCTGNVTFSHVLISPHRFYLFTSFQNNFSFSAHGRYNRNKEFIRVKKPATHLKLLGLLLGIHQSSSPRNKKKADIRQST